MIPVSEQNKFQLFPDSLVMDVQKETMKQTI